MSMRDSFVRRSAHDVAPSLRRHTVASFAAVEAIERRRLLSGDGAAETLPGDINGDNAVNGTDFAILAGNFGKSGMSAAQGDLNGDGSVNGSDFAILAGNFGKTITPARAAGDPDPTFGGGDGAADVVFDEPGFRQLVSPPSVDTRGGFTVVVINGGAGADVDAALARLDSAGQLDPSFGGDGRLVLPNFTALDVQIQEDRKILVAGRS